jgi:putative peptidoglycan lipid II flippase
MAAPDPTSRSRNRDVVRHSGTTSIAAALGVASGLALDVAIAASFGAGARTDAFFVAARLPLGIAAVLMVAANQAIVPAISTWLAREEGRRRPRQLVTSLFVATVFVGVAVAIAASLIATPLVRITAPGLDGVAVETASRLARILFAIVPLVAAAEILRALLNALHSFAAPAMMHVVLNGVAAAIVIGSGSDDISVVAWAYVVGAVAQLAFLAVAVARHRFFPAGGVGLRDPRITEAGALSVRPLVGASLNPLARVGEQAVISFLPPGSIAIMNYGYRLISAIGGSVLFRSVIVVTLPRLTRATAEGRDAEVRQLTRLGVQIMLAVSVPLTALVAVLARPAVIAVFQRERFSAEDATLLGTVLAVYASSLVGSAVQRALLAPFFARLDTKVPLRNTLYGVVANLALLPLLVLPFGDDPYGVVGVAIAYSAAQYVNVAHAWFRLRRDTAIRLTGVGDTAIRLAIAGVAMAGAMAVAVSVLEPEAAASRVEQLVDVGIAGAIGVVVFTVVAAALGLLGLGRRFRSVRGGGGAPPTGPPLAEMSPDVASATETPPAPGRGSHDAGEGAS